jgi:hypothetical protein
MARITWTVSAVLFLLPLNGACSIMAQDAKPKQALTLKLEAVQEVVRPGTEPRLRLTIENVSNADEKVLKPRGDLQDTYYRLVVSKGGNQLSLGAAISDPGPISEADFLTLKPGKKVTFEFSRYAVAVHTLPAGKYQAQIRFWQDPYKSHTSAVLSPAATFRVEK